MSIHLTLATAACLFVACSLAAQGSAWLPNRGQWPPNVRAALRHGAQTTWLTDRGWITRAIDCDALPKPRVDHGPEARLPVLHAATVDVELVGAASSAVALEEPLPGTVAFYVDLDSTRWTRGVPRFGKAVSRDVWPGIDLVFAMREAQLCYDLHVAPGAVVESICLRFSGAESVQIDRSGGITIATPCGVMRHGAPVAWQIAGDGTRRPANVKFVERDAGSFGFCVTDRDPLLALVIDPPLQWIGLHGGTAGEYLAQQCLDRSPAGDLVVCGATNSFDFPTPSPTPTSGGLDGFVTAFSAGGTLLWGAVIGGSRGADFYRACRWDAQGGVVFAGRSSSWNHPTTVGAMQPVCAGPLGYSATGDMVVGRVQPGAGGVALTWATFLGLGGDEQVNGLALMPGNQVAVTGWTNSALPTHASAIQPAPAGGFEAYVAVLDPSATGSAQFVAGTFLGGGALDYAASILANAAGLIYLGGASQSTLPTPYPCTNDAMQPTNSGQYDGVVSICDPTLSVLIYGTYLGGTGSDGAQGIAVDQAGRIAVADWTGGFSFALPGAFQPTVNSAEDGFVLLLDRSLWPASQVVWGTYFGGTMQDGINGVAIDAAGRLTVVGAVQGPALNTAPTGFATTMSPLQPNFVGGPGGTNGHWDAFVARFDPHRQGSDQLVYSTFLGGTGLDYAYDLLLDDRARPIVVGPSQSPTLLGATSHGGWDAFLAHIDLLANTADRVGLASPVCAAAFADAYHKALAGPGVDLTVTCSNAPPAALALLAFGLPNAAGTPVTFPPTLVVYLSFAAPIVLLGPFVTDSEGHASCRFTVQGSAPPYGLSAQWVLFGGCAGLEASDALRL